MRRNAEDSTADEVIELSASELLRDEVTNLKFVKWQDVQSITVRGNALFQYQYLVNHSYSYTVKK